MLIRTQFSSEAFGRLIAQRAAAVRDGCPQVLFAAPDNPLARILITHVRLAGAPTLGEADVRSVAFPNVSGSPTGTFSKRRIAMTVPLEVRVEKVGRSQLPVPAAPQAVKANFALDLTVINGEDCVKAEFLGTDQDGLFAALGADTSRIVDIIGSEPIPLHLVKGLTKEMSPVGAALTPRHVDLGFSPSAGRVEIRVECALGGAVSDDSQASWSDFYAGRFDAVLPENEWGVLIDQRIGSGIIRREVNGALDGTGRFRRGGETRSVWDPSLPGYRMSVDGEVVDACLCPWGLIDVDVTLSASVSASLAGGSLRFDVRGSYELTDDIETVCCEVTLAVAIALGGATTLATGQLAWHQYLVGAAMLPEVVPLVTGGIAGMGSAAQLGMPGELQQDPNDPAHVFMEVPLPKLPQPDGCGPHRQVMQVATLLGRGDGLAIGGSLNLPLAATPDIVVEATRLTYHPSVRRCSGVPGEAGYEATIHVSRNGGNHDFEVCDVILLDGDLTPVTKKTFSASTCPTNTWITIDIPYESYLLTDVSVVVVTSVGGRQVVVPAGAPVSDAERQHLETAAQAERISRCYAKQKRWDIKWRVDPPDVLQKPLRQLWAVTGRTTGRTEVVFRTPEHGVQARLRTLGGKAFRVSLLADASELSVEQVDADAADLQASEICAVQTLLVREQEQPVRGQVIALDAVRATDGPLLLIHEAETLTVLAQSSDQRFRTVGEVATQPFSSMARRGTSLIASTPEGGLIGMDLRTISSLGPLWQAVKGITLPAAHEEERSGNLVKDRQFDFLRHHNSAKQNRHAGETHARLQPGLLLTDTDTTSVLLRPDLKITQGEELDFEEPALFTRLGRGRYAAIGQNGTVEILRQFQRLQL